MIATLIWYVIFALLIKAAFLIARNYRRRQHRREWERTHKNLSWKDWNHLQR